MKLLPILFLLFSINAFSNDDDIDYFVYQSENVCISNKVMTLRTGFNIKDHYSGICELESKAQGLAYLKCKNYKFTVASKNMCLMLGFRLVEI